MITAGIIHMSGCPSTHTYIIVDFLMNTAKPPQWTLGRRGVHFYRPWHDIGKVILCSGKCPATATKQPSVKVWVYSFVIFVQYPQPVLYVFIVIVCVMLHVGSVETFSLSIKFCFFTLLSLNFFSAHLVNFKAYKAYNYISLIMSKYIT